MRYLTYNRTKGVHFAPDSQPITLYLRRKGRWGVERASGPDDLEVLVRDPKTGRPISKKELTARGQATGIIAPPPPPPTVNWQSIPSYSLGSGDVHIKGGYYRQEGYGRAAFHAGYNNPGRLILEDVVVWSDGPIVGGFRGRALFLNVLGIVTPPTGAGQAPPFAVSMEEVIDFEADGLTIIGGRKLFFSGKDWQDARGKQFMGDPYKGEGVRLKRVKYHNVDGRISDGQGSYRRSNWGATHTGSNVSAQTRINLGGEIGWEVGNVVQFLGLPRMTMTMKWIENLQELGKGRTEDNVNFFGGSGCIPEAPGLIEDVLLDSSGGWDWNRPLDADATVPYNPSNQVMAGATSGQDANSTRYSGTGLLIGDEQRSNYADNTAYITARRVTTIGARPFISQQAGHDIGFEQCELYETDRHWSGVPWTPGAYTEGYYQINSSTKLATDGRRIFGGLRFFDNILSEKGATEGPFSLSTAQMENGGSQGGNIRKAMVTDGGAAAIQRFRARAQAAGVVIGSTLPIPADVAQWASTA